MGNYAKAALAAHRLITKDGLTPLDAWNRAISLLTSSPTARKKVCPRTTFLTLAENGYLEGVEAQASFNRGGVLRERAIEAARLMLSNPDATHRFLSEKLEYVDRQGSYDIVIELAKNKILKLAK